MAIDTTQLSVVDEPVSIDNARTRGDRIFRRLAAGAAFSTFAIMALIGGFLLTSAWPALQKAGFKFFTEQAWRPDESAVFGIGSLLVGTVILALIALLIAVPVSVATALFITEYSPLKIRRPLTALVDLLAAVPSLIFGVWGLFYLQPKMIGLGTWLSTHLGFIPIFKTTPGITLASSPFIGGVVLALMIVPIVTSVVREVFSQTPPVEKEGALALGATRWGMIRTVVLPFGRGGIIGGSMLGMGRALGETIALALILSPAFERSPRILEPTGNSIAAHIALKFGEAQQLGLSALMAAGLALFALTLLVNTAASFVVARSRSGKGVEI